MERTIATPGLGTESHDTQTRAWRPLVNAAQSLFSGIGYGIRTAYTRARAQLSAEVTPAINIDKIARRLRVIERGKEDGGRNLPASNEQVPSGVQREVIAHFMDLRRFAHKQAGYTIQAASKALEQLDEADARARLREVPVECESRILRYLTDVECRLQHVREREFNQKKHYEAFREKNKLDRVATYPDYPFFYYLVVPLLIAGFAAVLTNWMVPESEGGRLPAGWIFAISTAVILIPFVLGGLSLRATRHVSDGISVAGWTGVVAVLAAIGFLAIYADFHIAAVLSDVKSSNREIFNAMRTAPLEIFSSVASWMTFGLFFLTGLLAMVLGFRSDDSYPGYGAVQRSYYQARDIRERAAQRLRSRIYAMIDDALSEVTRITNGYKARFRTCTKTAHKAALCPAILREYDVELEDACNVVLDRYRAENSMARNTDAPLSFNEHICFNAEVQPTASRQAIDTTLIDSDESAPAALEREADAVRRELRSMNLRMINSELEPRTVDPGK